ncbi:ABC transporter permease [Gammaproteobacteria bacterium]|nr:ABC transporter permease [Gammaproteobacteria bacterium]
MTDTPHYRIDHIASAQCIYLAGSWRSSRLVDVERQIEAIAIENLTAKTVVLDCRDIAHLDVNAACLIDALRTRLAVDRPCMIENLNSTFAPLLAIAESHEVSADSPRNRRRPLAVVERCGRAVYRIAGNSRDMLEFLGRVVVYMIRALLAPRRRIRITALVHHLERTGIDSLPIVGMLTFLVGVVLAYMSADQLKQFGAEIFTINLLGISILREMGILITAIIIAGRSGSAFTAQIGAMKVNQEIDAMRTIGIEPMEVLVIPRVLALVIAMPLLALFANFMGVLGGAVMIVTTLDISVSQFLRQFQQAVAIDHLWIGLVKAPIFGFIIALVGCYEGLNVSSNAESVGMRTTRSVVQSIALVIIVDAVFVVFFSAIGI